MRLVYDNVVESIYGEFITTTTHGLEGSEEKSYRTHGLMMASEHAIAIFVAKNLLKFPLGPSQDRFLMTEIENARMGLLLQELPEIKDDGHGLTKTARHDDEAFLDSVGSSFDESGDAFFLIRAGLIDSHIDHSLSIKF